MTFTSRPAMTLLRLVLAGVALGAGVLAFMRAQRQPSASDSPAPSAASAAPSSLPAVTAAQLDGHEFPDHVLALTWDDGPDTGTKALATYLAGEHIAATFFVVESWAQGVSSDPGTGAGVFETGYAHMPVLADLVKLRHRIGNHTRHHVLLTEVDAPVALREVRENQERIDPFLTNELRLLRAPGGAWSVESARAVAGDPYLAGLVGPVRWDVDRKDWDNSVQCDSKQASEECELEPGGKTRVKASVTAARYLKSIDEAKHGIVLFHDRVGDVGSDYAMSIAQIVVPALKERGYVFAAPVLAFGPLRSRASPEGPVVGFADTDGDGHEDLWTKGAREGVVVQRSLVVPGAAADRRPFCGFAAPAPADANGAPTRPKPGKATAIPGVDGDGVLAGDLNGDGRADACGRTPAGFACALATTTGFAAPSVWSHDAFATSHAWLADLNGDGRADLCVEQADGLACGLAP
jgi:peptidoglycan/xylan/chitin deacetylase (PgdA/CDA1 family)